MTSTSEISGWGAACVRHHGADWRWGVPLTAHCKPAAIPQLRCCPRVVTKGLRRGFEGVTKELRRESGFSVPLRRLPSAFRIDAAVVAQAARKLTLSFALARPPSPRWCDEQEGARYRKDRLQGWLEIERGVVIECQRHDTESQSVSQTGWGRGGRTGTAFVCSCLPDEPTDGWHWQAPAQHAGS